MNRAVCVTTWREFKSNKVRLIILVLLFAAPIFCFSIARCGQHQQPMGDLLSPPFMAVIYTLLWGAGMIGREVQHGTIALVLARPISIVNYVVSKWFAVGVAASVCAFEAVLVEHLISTVYMPSLAFQPEFIINGLERVFICFGVAAVMTLLSSLVSGLKDMALLAGYLFVLLMGTAAYSLVNHMASVDDGKNPWVPCWHLARVLGKAALYTIYPTVPVPYYVAGDLTEIFSLFAYVTLVTCCLSIAIFALSRKEFSYASE